MFTLAPATKRLLEFLLAADYGDKFSYAEILQQTGCDVSGEGRDYQRLVTVNRILERDHLRSIGTIRGYGKQVRLPGEHVDGAQERRRRAAKQTTLALRTLDATNQSLLSQSDLRELVDTRAHLSQLDQMVRFHNNRLNRIEKHLGIAEPPSVDGTAEEEQG